jgi:HK97 family phage major capsid protein
MSAAAVFPSGRVEVGAPNFVLDAMGGFAKPGDFFAAITSAKATGRVDERLRPLAAAGSDEDGQYSDPAGGYLAPLAISPTIHTVAPADPCLYMWRFPMATPTVDLPSRVDRDHSTAAGCVGGVVFQRQVETVDITPSRAKLEQIRFVANEMAGLIFATERLVQDNPAAVAQLIGDGFRDGATYTLVRERLFGSGTGESLGAINPGNPALLAIAKEAGQTAGTVVADNVLKMSNRVYGYEDAVWVVNPAHRRALQSMTAVVGTAGGPLPIYQFPTSEGDRRPRLLGRPVYYLGTMKAAGTQGDIACINWSEYGEGTRSFTRTESAHVRFLAVEVGFRANLRCDARPLWVSTLTPENGSDTLSPYVTLQARA